MIPGPEHYDVGTEAGCWIWKGSKSTAGYGSFLLDGKKRIYAHRWFYEKENGVLNAGMVVHHICKNRSCVNPAHLCSMSLADHSSHHSKGHIAYNRIPDKYCFCGKKIQHVSRGCGSCMAKLRRRIERFERSVQLIDTNARRVGLLPAEVTP